MSCLFSEQHPGVQDPLATEGLCQCHGLRIFVLTRVENRSLLPGESRGWFTEAAGGGGDSGGPPHLAFPFRKVCS